MSKLITTCQGDLLKRFFFRKDSFFCLSLKLERVSSWLSHKNFSAVSSKPLSVCPLQQFVVKIFSVKNVFLSSFSDIQQKLVNFFKTLSIKLTKLHSTRPQDHFEDISLFWQSFCLFFQWFMEIKRRNNGFFCRKTIGSFVNPAYHVSKGILRREFFPMFFFFHYWALSDFSLSFLRKFVGPVVSTVFCLSNGPVCGEKTFVQKCHFWTLTAKWSVFVRRFFGQVDDTAFYRSKGSIWGHMAVLTNFCLFYLFFADPEPKNQGFFPGNNRQVCQNCSPRVQGIFCRECFSKKILFLFDHWALIDFCLSFWRKHVGPFVSTVFCLSIRSVCGEKIFLKYFSPLFLDIDRKLISLWSIFFSAKWRHCFLRVRRITLKTSICFENFLYVFSSFWNIERKINGFFCRKTNSSFVKTDYHLSRRSVEEIFFRKDSFFAHHWNLSEFVLGFPTKTSLRCRQNCCLSVRCNILW